MSDHSMMAAEKNQALLAYFHFVLRQMKLTPPQLAELAGIAPSTITRFLNSDTYKFTPSSSTIAKVAKATGISPSPFYDAEDFTDLSMSPYQIENRLFVDTYNFGLLKRGIEKISRNSTFVVGDAEAGRWAEPRLLEIGDNRSIPVIVPSINRELVFALYVKGKNIDRVAVEGDVLVCCRVHKESFISSGDLIVVERSRDAGGLIETSARALVRTSPGTWILANASDDTSFAEELPTAPVLDDQAGAPMPLSKLSAVGLKIVGVVLFVYRQPRQPLVN